MPPMKGASPRITVRFEAPRRGLRDRDLAGPAEHALRREGYRGVRLGILATDDRRIARIHRDRLGVDGPTDVITFQMPWEPGDPPDGDSVAIVLSIQTAARESRRRGLALRDEVALYVVHGVLHAVGWDDRTKRDRRRMHERTAALLVELGLRTDVHHPDVRPREGRAPAVGALA